MAANSPCHRCDRTPIEMNVSARFLECFCGPCCPTHGFRCKHDFEWVCIDCQNDCTGRHPKCKD